ncbi:MAG: DUF6541 family protein [Patescibacteria group bacterium]
MQNRKKILFYCVIGILFVIFIFAYFYNIFLYKYPVPPGDDPIRHITAAKYILDNFEIKKYSISEAFDPPIFHILIATIASITKSNIIDVTKFFTPFLCIIAIFSLYFVSRQFFKKSSFIIIIAIILYGFFSPSLDRIYNDGTYLNIFSALYYLPLSLSCLIRYLNSNKKILSIKLLLLLIFSFAVYLSHSLSAIYYILILFLITIYSIYLYFIKKNKIILNKILFFDLINILFLFLLAWNFYVRGTVLKILNIFGISTNQANILSETTVLTIPHPLSIEAYSSYSGIFIFILSILGFIFILKKINISNVSKIILLVWILALFIGSRSAFFQLPHRFTRDMALPLTLLAAYGIYIGFRFICSNGFIGRIFFSIILSIIFVFYISNNLRGVTKYNLMIRVQESDQKAMEWIVKNTNKDDVILGMPLTIVASGWGSYINLLTDRKTFDGNICPQDDEPPCDPIFNPNSEISKKYYLDNSIDYVYAGKVILGGHLAKESLRWDYQNQLSKAYFLEEVYSIKEKKFRNLGYVKIFKVNKNKLNDQ